MENETIFNELIADVSELQKNGKDIYIYGAGFYGKDVYRVLKKYDIDVKGFLVTKDLSAKQCLGIPVYLASQKLEKSIGIVIAMTPIYANEVKQYLIENGVDMNNVIYAGIFEVAGRDRYSKTSVLEITTAIGCSVNCKFCPQSTLISQYYKNNSVREKYLSAQNFEIIISHVEEDCVLMFAGFGEPFLNPDCMKLLEIACKSGHKVHFFSTLVGASVKDIDKLITLPIDLFTLHAADKYGNANIPLTGDYYKKVEMVLNAKKSNGQPFVDYANAQGEADERVEQLCKDKVEIMISVHDRAGNVKEESAEHIKMQIEKTDKIKCQCVGATLNSNVVLPDGTLLLCNSDYGMQHVLGNLIQDDIGIIRSNVAFQEIQMAFQGKGNIDLLCRKCTNARIVFEKEDKNEID